MMYSKMNKYKISGMRFTKLLQISLLTKYLIEKVTVYTMIAAFLIWVNLTPGNYEVEQKSKIIEKFLK